MKIDVPSFSKPGDMIWLRYEGCSYWLMLTEEQYKAGVLPELPGPEWNEGATQDDRASVNVEGKP